MKKLKTGIFKFTCCAGCQFQILYFQNRILEMFDLVDFVYFRMASSRELEEDRLDLALIEGSISTPDEIERLKEIREMSDVLVAMGACAADGGVQAIKNRDDVGAVHRRVYQRQLKEPSIEISPVDEFVHADHYLRECPLDDNEFFELITSLSFGRRPYIREHPVCVECKLNANVCILLRREGVKESMCLGPVTRGGCGAICTTNMRACFGCRGPMSNPNIEEMVRTFIEKGFTKKDIEVMFTEYAGLREPFKQGAKAFYERKEIA